MKQVYYSKGWAGSWDWEFDLRMNLPGFTDRQNDTLNETQRKIIDRHCTEMLKELEMEHAKRDPEKTRQKNQILVDMRKAFADAGIESIFVEEIPNEYCGDACCVHKPWLKVTTSFGPVKVGWRKSVIHLGWNESALYRSSEELFHGEDVTKFARGIHAWGYEKLTQYLKVLVAASREA